MTSNYLFHGTCLKNAKSILENGFDGNEGEQIWNVSGGSNYFWSLKDLAKVNGETAKYAIYEASRMAQEAGETALIQNDCSFIVVFQVKASEVNYEDDFSCENMGGAVVSHDSVPTSAIEKIWISEDLSCFKPFMLATTKRCNNYLRNEPEVSPALNAAAEAIKDVYFDYSEHIEMEEITREQLANW